MINSKKTILLLYGGIGDTIMAYEQFKNLDIKLILATNSAKEVLLALDCNKPINNIVLSIGASGLYKYRNVYEMIKIYFYLLVRHRGDKIVALSFMKLWSALPFLNINHFPNSYKDLPRSEAIRRVLQ